MYLCGKPDIFKIDVYGFAAVIGLTIIAGLAVLRPLDRLTTSRRQKQIEIQQQYQELSAQQASLTEIARQRDALAEHITHIGDPLREYSDQSEVIRQIGLLAKSCDVQLNDILTGETESLESCRRTSLTVKLSGSFPAFRRFLNTLNQQLPFLRVENFSLESRDEKQASSCLISMRLDVFSPQ
jgi:Tfp pilus assembly protein PilO